MNKILMLVFLCMLVIPASATSIEYGNGWQKECYDDGKCSFSNAYTYPIYNSSYLPESINYMVAWGTGYDLFWNGGLLQTVWDGTYAYDMIAYPENGTAISPWAFWKVEYVSKVSPQGVKTWKEEVPQSNTFVKIDNSTLRREMVLAGGLGTFNITYHNEGTRIKQDLELDPSYDDKEYRLTYRIDSVAAQDVNPDSDKFTPDFFNNFTVWDVTDVEQYKANLTFNRSSQIWEGDGSYISGWNTTASIDNTEHKYYLEISNGQPVLAGQKIYIDPSWSVGLDGSAWTGNSTKDNTTLNRDTNRVMLRQEADDYISYWRFDGSSGTTAYDENTTSNNLGTLYNSPTWGSGVHGNALTFNGATNWVEVARNAGLKPAAFTLSFWVTSPSAPGSTQQYIISFGNEDFLYTWGHSAVAYRQAFVTEGGANKVKYVSSLSGGTWYHFTVVYNGTSYIYLNGTYEAQVTSTITPDDYSIHIGSGAWNEVEESYFPGTIDDMRFYNRVLTGTEINQIKNNIMKSSGNLTTWHDAGTGNETYQIDVNATTDANSNYTVWYADNGTGSYTQLGGTLTGNNSLTISGTKYQDTDVQVRFAGNTTSTPELISVTFFTQATSTLYDRTADVSVSVTAGSDRTFSAFRNADIPIIITANTDRQLAAFRNAVQVFTIADSTSATFIDVGELFERFAVQAISITDSISKMQTHVRLVEQAFSIADSVQRTLSAQRGVQQAVTIADSASRALIANRAVQQVISIADSVSRTYTAAGTLFIRYAEMTITVADSAARDFWAGVYYTVSGYVKNVLEFPLEDARVDQVGGNYSFTDAAGYYSIVVPAGDRDILGRAIGYENLTKSISVSGNTALNMTLPEFRPPDYTSLIESILGIVVVLMALIIVAVKRKKKKQTNINKKNGDNEVW